MQTTREYNEAHPENFLEVSRATAHYSTGSKMTVIWENRSDIEHLVKVLDQAEEEGVDLASFQSEEFTTAVCEELFRNISEYDLELLITKLSEKLPKKQPVSIKYAFKGGMLDILEVFTQNGTEKTFNWCMKYSGSIYPLEFSSRVGNVRTFSCGTSIEIFSSEYALVKTPDSRETMCFRDPNPQASWPEIFN